MSKLICPFCGEKIEHIEDGWCNCKNRCTGSGSIDLWLQFLRTRKALDKAKWWLHDIVENHRFTPISTAEMALEDITALEQKD